MLSGYGKNLPTVAQLTALRADRLERRNQQLIDGGHDPSSHSEEVNESALAQMEPIDGEESLSGYQKYYTPYPRSSNGLEWSGWYATNRLAPEEVKTNCTRVWSQLTYVRP